MSGLLKAFTNALQSGHLKEQGFQKRYETFSRQHPKFSEYYHIQPTNRAGDTWSFHLIVGIGFSDIPSKQKGQLAGCHASKRYLTVETTLLTSSDTDLETLREEAARVAGIILAQSEYLLSRYPILRHSYDRAILHEGFPADPETDLSQD
jgi:hypothetical protein